MNLIETLRKDFEVIFSKCDTRIFFAPGRVNLIGEHTDYNGGHVFPAALDFGTYGVFKEREDNKVRLYSKNFSNLGIMEFTLEDLTYNKHHDWGNYPKGVIKIFKDKGYNINKGMDILFYGNIPNGAGLSSSASIELVAAVALNKLFNLNIDMISMVKMCQMAENDFIGVKCGIMDQFAIGMGKKNRAILLDCNSLKYKYCNLDLKDISIIISNTNKRRGLNESKYNNRRDECERALLELKNNLNINSLGELTEEEFEENKHLITNSIDRKRAKHAVYENRRTLKASKVLEEGNIKEFGKLMKESHISLRNDYEVTGKELDTLVELELNQDGVIGSRMTGAGFGGCTISLVKNDGIDKFIENVGMKYFEKIGYHANFYIGKIGDGAREL
ncbi:galactokinase [Dethiothermospora halolimnae]|uniref:galactokinase n=1 Tax=Dethiothermospora halolimnae TaxID=3114390 RepID=UPI003CCBEAF8